MINERKILIIEYAAIILLWTLVIIAPLLFMDDYDQNWRAVHVMWAECAVVGFAFLINRFILMPYLFFKRRYVKYIISLLVLFFILALFVLHLDGVNVILSLVDESPLHDMPFHDMPPQRPPHGGGGAMPGMPHASVPPVATVIPPMIFVLILSAITIALDMGLRIAVTWVMSEQRRAEENRERMMTQLLNLQSQVSPHFFMNTLNNIHALVDIDPGRAKQTIIELSSLMDYLLYDSSTRDRVSLQRELDFISSYINLMKLRFSSKVKINFSYGDNPPSVKIPPLLFLNFIENTFKYGVDSDRESIITIRFKFSDTLIEMMTINDNHSSTAKGSRHGLGISNSRKRLDLLYGDRYRLNISEKEKIYYVDLKIPIV